MSYQVKRDELFRVINELREIRNKIEAKSQFVSEDKRDQIIKRYNYKKYCAVRVENNCKKD